MEAKLAIREIQNMGIEAWMITGDNQTTAKATAHELGITQYFAEVKPSQKAEKVKQLKVTYFFNYSFFISICFKRIWDILWQW